MTVWPSQGRNQMSVFHIILSQTVKGRKEPLLEKESINFCFLLNCRRDRNKLTCRRNGDSVQFTMCAILSQKCRDKTATLHSADLVVMGLTFLTFPKEMEHFSISTSWLIYGQINRIDSFSLMGSSEISYFKRVLYLPVWKTMHKSVLSER